VDEDRLAQSDPDAGGRDAESAAAAAQLTAQVDHDARRRGAQWVADGDGAAVDVEPLRVDPRCQLLARKHDGREGLVDLPEVDVRLTPHLVQYYGLVEAIPPVTVLDASQHARGLAGEPELLSSAGRPALGVEIAVVDEAGLPVALGEAGEVITRGDHVMAGYYNPGVRTDLSKAVRDGWLHTGDLGRLDAEGNLWLVDRKGDMIIRGGYNIHPREVEDVVAEVAGVHEVAVVGVDDADWGQRVVALVTAQPDADPTALPDAIAAHCRDRLASYKKPKEVRVVPELPLNSTGKIAKKDLKAPLNAEAGAAGAAPAGGAGPGAAS